MTAAEPADLILADEPASRLDVSVQAHVIRPAVRRMDEGGPGVLVIRRELELVRAVCQRVGFPESRESTGGPSRFR